MGRVVRERKEIAHRVLAWEVQHIAKPLTESLRNQKNILWNVKIILNLNISIQKQSLIKTQPQSFCYILSITLHPKMAEKSSWKRDHIFTIFTHWLFTENFADPW